MMQISCTWESSKIESDLGDLWDLLHLGEISRYYNSRWVFFQISQFHFLNIVILTSTQLTISFFYL